MTEHDARRHVKRWARTLNAKISLARVTVYRVTVETTVVVEQVRRGGPELRRIQPRERIDDARLTFIDCPLCKRQPTKPCSACDGEGTCKACRGSFRALFGCGACETTRKCRACAGTGRHTCWYCGGEGVLIRLPSESEVEITTTTERRVTTRAFPRLSIDDGLPWPRARVVIDESANRITPRRPAAGAGYRGGGEPRVAFEVDAMIDEVLDEIVDSRIVGQRLFVLALELWRATVDDLDVPSVLYVDEGGKVYVEKDFTRER